MVCCQQQSKLKDAAALAVMWQFYLSIAVGHTVKESFEQGCKVVHATPNLHNAEEEMMKFIQTVSSGRKGLLQHSNSRHRSRPGRGLIPLQSVYFGSARSSELLMQNMMQEVPSLMPPQFFTSREVDMYHILNAVLTQKLVSVIVLMKV